MCFLSHARIKPVITSHTDGECFQLCDLIKTPSIKKRNTLMTRLL